jgi:hypothetical protein
VAITVQLSAADKKALHEAIGTFMHEIDGLDWKNFFCQNWPTLDKILKGLSRLSGLYGLIFSIADAVGAEISKRTARTKKVSFSDMSR